MKKLDVEAAELVAMSLEQLEEFAAPVVAALRTKREVLSKEESKRRKQEYDRRRRAATVAVTVRLADAKSAEAIRNLVRRIVSLSQQEGRTVADIVSATEKRMPVGRRKPVGKPKSGEAKKTTGSRSGKPKNESATRKKTVATSEINVAHLGRDVENKSVTPSRSDGPDVFDT